MSTFFIHVEKNMEILFLYVLYISCNLLQIIPHVTLKRVAKKSENINDWFSKAKSVTMELVLLYR